MNRGAIYLVTGKKIYLDEAVFSAKSLKKHCPEIPITIFTDSSNIKESCFDEVELIESNIHPFKNKVKHSPESPYEFTLYLDSDTKVVKPIYEMFEWLEEYDLGVANTPNRNRSGNSVELINNAGFDRYNTGVIAYKKSERTKKFFDKWLKDLTPQNEANMWSGHFGDQHYFNKLIRENYHTECQVRLKIFPNRIYNARRLTLKQLKKAGEMEIVKIIHMHGLHLSPLYLFLWKAYRKLKNQRTGILTRDLLKDD